MDDPQSEPEAQDTAQAQSPTPASEQAPAPAPAPASEQAPTEPPACEQAPMPAEPPTSDAREASGRGRRWLGLALVYFAAAPTAIAGVLAIVGTAQGDTYAGLWMLFPMMMAPLLVPTAITGLVLLALLPAQLRTLRVWIAFTVGALMLIAHLPFLFAMLG